MSVDVFLDTNVLIYQLDRTDARKHGIAEAIVKDAVANDTACISFQVVQECLNTALRKSVIALDLAGARGYLETVLSPLLRGAANLVLYRRSLDIQERYRFGCYDALIVAAALEAGCKRLLSEDLQHGQKIETLRIENPFRK